MFACWTRSLLCAALAMGAIEARAQRTVSGSRTDLFETRSNQFTAAQAVLSTNPPGKLRRGFTAIAAISRHALATTKEKGDGTRAAALSLAPGFSRVFWRATRFEPLQRLWGT